MSETYEFLNETIKRNAMLDKDIELNDSLKEDLGLDSLAILSIADEIEEKYGISIEAEDLANITQNVGGFVKLIDGKTQLLQ
jgi:acyl carrier protein